jgi:hypothetical protein
MNAYKNHTFRPPDDRLLYPLEEAGMYELFCYVACAPEKENDT